MVDIVQKYKNMDKLRQFLIKIGFTYFLKNQKGTEEFGSLVETVCRRSPENSNFNAKIQNPLSDRLIWHLWKIV